MTTLARSFPGLLPDHKNGRADRTHPVIQYRWPAVDHDPPGKVSGTYDDPDDWVASCWPCNQFKGIRSGAQLGLALQQPHQAGWSGLVDYADDLETKLKEAGTFGSPIPPLSELQTQPRSDMTRTHEPPPSSDPATAEAISRLDTFAKTWQLTVQQRTGKTREYGAAGQVVVWVYLEASSWHGATEWNLRDAGREGHLNQIRSQLEALLDQRFKKYARISCANVVGEWQRLEPILENLVAAARVAYS